MLIKKKISKENFDEIINDLAEQLHKEVIKEYAIYGPYSNGTKSKITLAKIYKFLGYGRVRVRASYSLEKMQDIIKEILNINKDMFVLRMIKTSTRTSDGSKRQLFI